MRSVALLLVLSLPSLGHSQAQAPIELQAIAIDVAHSLAENPAKRGVQPYAMPPAFRIVVQDSTGLNAHANVATNTVFLDGVTVLLFKGDRGELAYVIAHEIGHLQDADCRNRGTRQGLKGAALQRMCEAAADAIAMQYMLAAGYNRYDAAGALGKLMVDDAGGQGTVIGIIAGRYTSDHPVTIDRIRNIAAVADAICHQRPEICDGRD